MRDSRTPAASAEASLNVRIFLGYETRKLRQAPQTANAILFSFLLNVHISPVRSIFQMFHLQPIPHPALPLADNFAD